jgi:uracil-DNA glycosylase
MESPNSPAQLLNSDWLSHLLPYFEGPDYQRVMDQILADEMANVRVFPIFKERYRAFELTPLGKVKCVIIGQDPYHGEGQANGLAFSVNKGMKLPPSLNNIFKELQSEYPNKMPAAIESEGDLSMWSEQGVLLLNAALTVCESAPLSHQNCGWEPLIQQVIATINSQCSGVVFVLWGKSAQRYKSFVDTEIHAVIEGVHPSPLSAHRGFFGSKPFSKINELLKNQGKSPIIW